MKAAAFLDLPMQAGSFPVVNLHAINAQVVFPGKRILGIDQRQRHEGAAVFVPCRKDR